ncbi:hypothetical protein I79_015120 [Cricetulus griseus]|uniref:Uncharacterized protein n=1 Tax=Cricetulus griseus TaxID=10029 RepID=G3HVX6_CRIGR|nr:hypothetical protein I79_015120 [Cricetulus griseus]
MKMHNAYSSLLRSYLADPYEVNMISIYKGSWITNKTYACIWNSFSSSPSQDFSV